MTRLIAVLASTLMLAACGSNPEKLGYVRSSGTLALSSDDQLLYAVDADNEIVAVVDTSTQQKIAEVKVGRWPEKILAAPDDTVYVANRGDRSVSVFRRGAWEAVQRVPVGVEPVGLALSSDEKTLFVVNAISTVDSDHGSLLAVDVKSLQAKWEMDLPSDPRSIALLDGDRAVISRYRPGDLVEVDVAHQRIVRIGTTLNHDANLRSEEGTGEGTEEPLPPPNPGFPSPGPDTVRPRGMSDVVVSPKGDRVYAPVVWASDSVLNGGGSQGAPSSGGGSYGGSAVGSCSSTTSAVTTPGLAAFDQEQLTPKVDALHGCAPNSSNDHPASVLKDPQGEPLQGPSALLVDQSDNWIFVALKESNNVAVLPTSKAQSSNTGGGVFFGSAAGTTRDVIPVGTAPTGLALSNDGRRLFVHSSFSHDIRVVAAAENGRLQVQGAPIQIAQDVLPPDLVEGRRLFFSATDSAMNSPQIGISCASCHLEGREDGHVWNFAEGPRQTPSLAGRAVSKTAPFHWGGEHPDFASFVTHTVGERMGGTGISPEQQVKLLAFIDSLPAADNPNVFSVPSDAQVRGAQAFQKAGCDQCHAGSTLTNNTFANVGTFVSGQVVNDDLVFLSKGLNTPSLLGVFRTAPYLHDGSVATLRDRIMRDRQRGSNAHGSVGLLSDAEVDDLVAYLKTL